MRAWVIEAEHILDGSWASMPEEISNAEGGKRLDEWLKRLSCFLERQQRTEDERLRPGHLLKVLTHVRPGLVQCYGRADFPRTKTDMERTIRAIKMNYRRISGRKNWNGYYYGMVDAWPIRSGGFISLMEILVYRFDCDKWLLYAGGRFGRKRVCVIRNNSTASGFVIDH
jgi:hypothetical protein